LASLDFFPQYRENWSAQKQATADPMPEQRKLETILTANKLVSEEQLKQIANYAHAVGIDLHEAVLQKKIAPPEAVMMAYAESVGLPFIHLADVTVDESVVVQVEPMTARQNSFVPISIDQGYVLLATTKPVIPDVADELRMIFDLPVRCVLCTPAELNDALTQYYPRGAVRVAKAEPEKVQVPVPKPKKRSKPTEPINDEEMKSRIKMMVVAFNFSFAFVFFLVYSLQIPRAVYNSDHCIYLVVLLGCTLGGLAASATWKILSR